MPKGQGKINPAIVARGLAQGKKKIDIAVEAGSNATTDQAKCNAVTEVMNSNEFEEEALPFVEQLEKERQRALDEMKIKDLDKVAYEKLSDVVDKTTKNIQLLTGKPTERTEVNIEQAQEIKKALGDI